MGYDGVLWVGSLALGRGDTWEHAGLGAPLPILHSHYTKPLCEQELCLIHFGNFNKYSLNLGTCSKDTD